MTDAGMARFKFPRSIIAIFFLLTVAILAAGFLYYKFQEKHMLGEEMADLTSVAALKVDQIERWKKERLADAEFVFNDRFFAKEVGIFLGNRKDASLREEVRLWMESFRKVFNYDSIRLFDASGGEIISVAPNNYAISDEEVSLVKEGLAKNEIFFSDIELEKRTGVIHIHVAVPLLAAEGGKGATVGLLFIAINPQEFLFPLIQSWPVPTSSGETLLVKRVGNDVLFLNDLRFAKDSAMKLTAPADAKDLPAAMAVRGVEGFVSGVDYRHVPVYAVVRPVLGFPWYIIAKVDKSEIDTPIRRRVFSVVVSIALIILTAFLAMSLWWRKREAKFYRAQYLKEEERQVLEKHYAYLNKYANDIIFVLDADKKFIEANEKAESVYGYTHDELLNMSAMDVRAEEEIPKIGAAFAVADVAGYNLYETVHKRRDGTTFPVEINLHMMEIGGRKFYQGIIRDVTERKRAEKEILTGKTFLDRVMYLSPFPMWISDEKGLLQRSNRALLEALNVSEEQIVGKYNVLKDGNLSDQGVMPLVRDVFEKQKSVRFMIPWKGAMAGEGFVGARDVIIDVSLFPIVDPERRVTNAVCQWIDVSDRVRAQEELVELNAELEQRVKDRTADLEEANRELESFTYSVSHDLRAPLRSIDGFSNMLMEDCATKLTEAEKNYLSRIHNAIAMMGELIDDMLSLSRISKTELHFTNVNLSEIIDEIAKRLKEREPERRVVFAIEKGLSVTGDKALLSAVLENLLENAWKFTSKHNEANIEFGARLKNGKRIFFIKDDGAGFDMRYVDKLFGPFQRLHTKEEFPGIGIGLASVKRIISRHGGRAWAEGAIEKGATFYFTIP